MNKISYLNALSKKKMNYIKNLPLNRREKLENVYLHNFKSCHRTI